MGIKSRQRQCRKEPPSAFDISLTFLPASVVAARLSADCQDRPPNLADTDRTRL